MTEERASESVEVEDEDRSAQEQISGLLDTNGDLLPHEEAEQEEVEQSPQKTAAEAKPVDVQEPDGQTEEIDYEGAKYRVPAALKDAFLRQSDYTRKTQEVAQQRAAVEQERQVLQRLASESQQYVGQHAAIQQIDAQLAQLQKVNWAELAQNDPLQHLQMRQSWTELVAMRQAAVGQLEQARQKAEQDTARMLYERVSKGHAELQRDIPDWGPQLQSALLETATKVGFRPEELATLSDPRSVKLLHKAYLYDQMQQQKTVAEKQVRQAPPKVVRPSASQGPTNEKPRNEHLARLRKSGRDEDAVAALRQLIN